MRYKQKSNTPFRIAFAYPALYSANDPTAPGTGEGTNKRAASSPSFVTHE